MKVDEYIKKNFFDTLSQKYLHDPEDCIEFLKDCQKRISNVQDFVNESLKVYERINYKNLKTKKNEQIN